MKPSVAAALVALSCLGPVSAKSKTPVPEWASARPLLEGLGARIKAAVVSGSTADVLAMVGPAGVACEFGSYAASKSDLADQFARKDGFYYGQLFDSSVAQKTCISYGVSPEGLSCVAWREMLAATDAAHLEIRGGASSGYLYWLGRFRGEQLKYEHAPRFGYSWSESEGKYVVSAIGCN